MSSMVTLGETVLGSEQVSWFCILSILSWVVKNLPMAAIVTYCQRTAIGVLFGGKQ